MIVLIEFLRKFISIIGDKSRRMRCSSLGNLRRESIEYLDNTNFLRRKGSIILKHIGSIFQSLCICLAENGLDTCMSVLDERSCIAVEVDGFLRIEEHGLPWVHLEDEVLKRSKAYHPEESVLFLGREIIDFAEFHGCLLGGIVHRCYKIVGVNDSSFAGLHLAFRKFYHTV